MTKKGFLGLLGLACTLNAGAQTTLDQAVEEALSHGADQAVWAAGWASSQAVEAAARARAGFSLSTSLGYSATQTQSDPAKTSDSVVPHTAAAGLTLAAGTSSLTLRGTRKMTFDGAGPNVAADGGTANLNVPLWNGYPGGSTQATADKAGLALKIAEWNSQSSRNKLIVTVKQAYFTLLSAQEALNQLTQTQKQRAEASKFAETRYSLGQATSLDLKQAQINARTADLDLAAGQSALETARRRLANLMGRPDEPLTVAAEPDPPVAVETLDQAVELALRQCIEPLVAQANARSAQIDADAAFGAATPSVTLTGTLNVSKNPASSILAYDGTLGVSIGAPLWDGGLSSAQQALANAQKTTAQIQYQQLLKSIPVDVAEGWNAWQVGRGRLDVAALALEVAEGQRLVVKTQFDAGLKTLSDLQTADIALSAAQLALLKAKITAQLSALTLQSLMGQ